MQTDAFDAFSSSYAADVNAAVNAVPNCAGDAFNASVFFAWNQRFAVTITKSIHKAEKP